MIHDLGNRKIEQYTLYYGNLGTNKYHELSLGKICVVMLVRHFHQDAVCR